MEKDVDAKLSQKDVKRSPKDDNDGMILQKRTISIIKNYQHYSKHYSDFYCLNCLHYFRTKNKLESHKKYEKIKIFVML